MVGARSPQASTQGPHARELEPRSELRENPRTELILSGPRDRYPKQDVGAGLGHARDGSSEETVTATKPWR